MRLVEAEAQVAGDEELDIQVVRSAPEWSRPAMGGPDLG